MIMFRIYFPRDFKFKPLRHGLFTPSRLLHIYMCITVKERRKQFRWEVHLVRDFKNTHE